MSFTFNIKTNNYVADVVNGLASFYKAREDFELIAFDFEVTKVTESQYIIHLTDMNSISVHLMHPKTGIVMVTFIGEDGYGRLYADGTYFINKHMNPEASKDGYEITLHQLLCVLEDKYSEAHETVNRTMENTV